MGKVTDIKKQIHNNSRVSIFLDGEFACGLDELALMTLRIKVGDELSDDELKAAVRAGELNSAFERAVMYISYAPRCRAEVFKHLREKGYDRDIIDDTLKKLDEYKYIDDYGYCASYIKSKSKKYGSFRIMSELRKKGIPSKIIEMFCDDNESIDMDGEAVAVARKYLSSHGNVDRQKLKRFLAGRGFSWDSISAAMSELEKSGDFCDDDDYTEEV